MDSVSRGQRWDSPTNHQPPESATHSYAVSTPTHQSHTHQDQASIAVACPQPHGLYRWLDGCDSVKHSEDGVRLATCTIPPSSG